MSDLIGKNNKAAEIYSSDRRGFLKHGLLFTAALGFWTPSLVMADDKIQMGRDILLNNAHTGEKFSGEYWKDGKYIPDAFAEIKNVMRDFRTNEQYPIDPRLIDVLFVLRKKMKNSTPFSVFSGYRSPKTNEKLRSRSEGVARASLHMQGQAVDVNLPGTRLLSLEKAALKLKIGGVGYYPKSGFVHIDTGRVRNW